MLQLVSEITIAKWRFTAVSNCQITEDINTLTDVMEIELPKNTQWEGEVMNPFKTPPIKRGDKIHVKLGYDGVLKTRFIGYVRTVDVKKTIKVSCDDAMFLLKTAKAPKKAYKTVTLKTLINDLLEGTGIDYECEDITLGSYRTNRATVSEVLEDLKKNMIRTYFRYHNDKTVLYAGIGYPFTNRKEAIFKHGKNIISEDLQYRRSEDSKIKIKATSVDNVTNKIINVEVGDADGEVQELKYANVSKSQLEKFAQLALKNLKYTGIKGSFETFGEPFVNKCDIVNITASDGNSGRYLIQKNEVTFGTNGYRQKIELGQPLSN